MNTCSVMGWSLYHFSYLKKLHKHSISLWSTHIDFWYKHLYKFLALFRIKCAVSSYFMKMLIPLTDSNWFNFFIFVFNVLQGKKNPSTDKQSVLSFLQQVKEAKEMKIDRYPGISLVDMFPWHHSSCALQPETSDSHSVLDI